MLKLTYVERRKWKLIFVRIVERAEKYEGKCIFSYFSNIFDVLANE